MHSYLYVQPKPRYMPKPKTIYPFRYLGKQPTVQNLSHKYSIPIANNTKSEWPTILDKVDSSNSIHTCMHP